MHKMRPYYQIDIDGYFSSYYFYSIFLPKLHDYFIENQGENNSIILNFNNTIKISPLVIPNLLNVGIILKRYFDKPIKAFFPWNIKLLSYLRDVNFFRINQEYNIFDIDERFTGGISISRSISDICGTIYIHDHLKKEEIYNSYISKYKSPLERQLKDSRTVDRLLFVMAELSHNGSQHSKSSCFVSFQLNQLNKFEFSVSDSGIGYKESLLGKNSQVIKNSICDDNSVDYSHFDSILRAVFFRKKVFDQVYGIFSIFNDVLPMNGVIRVHTYDTQAIFTKNNFCEFLYDDQVDKIFSSICCSFVDACKTIKDNKYKPLRINQSKFKGVHIEVEIPFGD